MIFGKDIIGIIDKYIERYRLTTINIEYVIYNKITGKRYNFRDIIHGKIWKNIYNKYIKLVKCLPKNY